ncbi:MAG: hypothetical protein EBU67_00110 [Actinobacteria bacterium]|jgi:hypothetical protein|nr:hypothetical protein [Actinomycetota bacterium]NBP52701.1 hypothetical protein [Actinomycetota bacterium]
MGMAKESSIQYRVAKSKKEEVVDGPDDAEVVVSIAATDLELGANVAYMRGKLKATGHTGVLLRALASGEIDRGLTAVASRL